MQDFKEGKFLEIKTSLFDFEQVADIKYFEVSSFLLNPHLEIHNDLFILKI